MGNTSVTLAVKVSVVERWYSARRWAFAMNALVSVYYKGVGFEFSRNSESMYQDVQL
jgi:hypothetical protein